MGRQLGLKSLVIPCLTFLQGQFLDFWSTVCLCIYASCKVCAEVGFPLPFSYFAAALHCLHQLQLFVPAAHDPLTRLRMCERQTRVSLVLRLLQSCTVACIGGMSNLVNSKFCSKRQANLLVGLAVRLLASIAALAPCGLTFVLQKIKRSFLSLTLRPSCTLVVLACSHGS